MMQRPHLRVSLVIPAFNEERHLAACLDSVAVQVERPFEVIVVDNNSTDATARIAASYPFVRVVHERRQGVVFARDAGFDAAKGEIIGRVDADSLLDPYWVVNVQRYFATHPSSLAVTGAIDYHDVPLREVVGRVDLWFRRRIAHRIATHMYLAGANMGLRRSAWRQVRGELCHSRALHEDHDLAVHLAHLQISSVGFEPNMRASTSARCMLYSFKDFYTYLMAGPRTYAAHGRQVRRAMYGLIGFLLVIYLPVRWCCRMYDADTGTLSLRNALRRYGAHACPIGE